MCSSNKHAILPLLINRLNDKELSEDDNELTVTICQYEEIAIREIYYV